MLESVPPKSYERVIVFFSGGKDSLACVLHLLDLGVCRTKIELWHHCVDGDPYADTPPFMDWPVTSSYCKAVAEALGLPIFFSWREGGFKREMLRDESPTAGVWYEHPNPNYYTADLLEGGERHLLSKTGGKSTRPGTRLKFPQVSADLRVRWCSSYLKIDVGSAAIRAQPRFNQATTLTVTGERADESPGRAKYKTFEPDRSDARAGRLGRHVDRWRPIHGWSEQQVWSIIKRYGIIPHPAYYAGWSRLSCAACIFGNDDQWSSVRQVLPEQFETIKTFETKFGVTIHRTDDIEARANRGEVYDPVKHRGIASVCQSKVYHGSCVTDPRTWTTPAGAYGKSRGPS